MAEDFIVAISIVLVQNDKVFIARRASNKDVGANTWEFPSGRLEENEAPEDAIRREGFEELGIQVNPIQIVHAYKFLRKTKPCVVLTYLCSSSQLPKLSEEHSEGKWVKLSRVKEEFSFQTQQDSVEALLKALKQ